MVYNLMKNNKAVGKVVNLGNETPEISIKKLAEMILKVTQKKLYLKEMEDTEGSPIRRAPSMKECYELTKFKPKISLEEGLTLTFEWYKKNVQ